MWLRLTTTKGTTLLVNMDTVCEGWPNGDGAILYYPYLAGGEENRTTVKESQDDILYKLKSQ